MARRTVNSFNRMDAAFRRRSYLEAREYATESLRAVLADDMPEHVRRNPHTRMLASMLDRRQRASAALRAGRFSVARGIPR